MHRSFPDGRPRPTTVAKVQGQLFPNLWNDKHIKGTQIKALLVKLGYVDDLNEYRRLEGTTSVEELSRGFTPEQLCAFESSRAGERR